MMRVLLSLVAAVLVVSGLVVVVSNPSQTAVAADDPDALIRAIADAYKRAPTLTDNVEVVINQGGAMGSESVKIVLGAGKDARVRMQGFVFTSVGDTVYVQQERLPGKYVGQSMDKDLINTLSVMTEGRLLLPAPQAFMRYRDDVNDHVQSLGMGIARNLKVTSVEPTTKGDKTFDLLKLAGEQGATVDVLVDPGTKFIRGITVDMGGGTFEFTMSPKTMPSLSNPLTVETEGKRKVDALADLRLMEGDLAPDFTLETSTGETVTLSDLRGNVVVLDFWATWCGPCKRGLPGLADFTRWADAEGHPVKVFGVNTGEHFKTDEETRKQVHAYWSGQKFPMPTLMDFDAKVARAFEVGPIPHAVVIGPDGTIVQVKIGFDQQALKKFQAVTLKVLESTG